MKTLTLSICLLAIASTSFAQRSTTDTIPYFIIDSTGKEKPGFAVFERFISRDVISQYRTCLDINKQPIIGFYIPVRRRED